MTKIAAAFMKMFTSWKIAWILLVHCAVLLAAATFVESKYGIIAARASVYNNPLFYLLLVLLVLNFVGIAWKQQLWKNRRIGVIIFHLAFVCILAGALVTSLFGTEGIMHIREGESSSLMRTRDASVELPFTVHLKDFRLVRYPGSQSPSSFESDLLISSGGATREESIYMNKVIYEQGYRLYQSSYDPDERGTVLTVNKDLPGTAITYTGYLLLLVGMIAMLSDSKSRFWQLNRRLKALTGVLVFLFCSSGLLAQTGDERKNTLPAAEAAKWARLQVQCPTGRMEPVNTYASKLLRKIHRSDSFEGLTAEQVILGLMINPEYWSRVNLIRQSNKELQKEFSLPGKHISLSDLFHADGKYKLADRVNKVYARPASERSGLEKDLLKLDEKANILYALREGQFFALFPLPGDPSGKWYSPGDDLSAFSGKDSLFVFRIMPWYLSEASEALQTGDWSKSAEVLDMISIYQQKQSTVPLLTGNQVRWELFYNRSDLFFWSAIGYVLLGLLLLPVSIVRMMNRKTGMRAPIALLALGIGLLFLCHTTGIGLRWYISGQAPVTNAYESMIFVAWATVLAGLLFGRRSAVTLSLAAFLAGVILFVAHLNWMDPQITPLVPVLKSYWLMIHVAAITSSYGFFGVSFLLGVLSLVFTLLQRKAGNAGLIQSKIKELRIINEMSLYIGLCLLIAGTFIGAVWANESWGRYWGWDPKETWALVTMIVYTLILHARFIPVLRSDYAFGVMSAFGFASVLMTYFGVNYYLTGLHSYGGGDTPPALNAIFIAYAVVLLLAVAAGWVERSIRHNLKHPA